MGGLSSGAGSAQTSDPRPLDSAWPKQTQSDALSPFCLLSVCFPALDCCVAVCCVHLSLAILDICLWAVVSASRLQSFRQLSPSSGLLCLPLACNPSHLSPSSGLLCPAILYICLPAWAAVACNPLHVSPCVYICLPALDCCVRLCLAILYICFQLCAVSAPSLQSLIAGVSQL